MEATESKLTEQESMKLIHNMIVTAKNQISEDGFLYLLWGWLVLAASLSNYALIKIGHEEYGGIAWIVMMFSGAIISMIYGKRKKKAEKVRTHLDEFMGYIWTAFGVCLGIVIGFGFKLGISTYPMVLMVYGFGTFISGGALKFRPLIIGGICCWALAICAFAVSFDYQLLLLSVALIVSYIIPGHLLKAKFANNSYVQNA